MSGTTSLFTDIVDSTEKAVELGDGGWAELLESHNSIVRAQLSRFHGQEMDTSGDGFFAIFPDPSQAIDAARSIQVNLRELDLRVRVGIHVGDCWVADDKCTGLAIHIGRASPPSPRATRSFFLKQRRSKPDRPTASPTAARRA
ncbi:MAG: adenylate/guanylate cyclase domain-containing protein [Gaiellaceae bacterium]